MTVKKFAVQDKYVGMWVTADGHIRHEFIQAAFRRGGLGPVIRSTPRLPRAAARHPSPVAYRTCGHSLD